MLVVIVSGLIAFQTRSDDPESIETLNNIETPSTTTLASRTQELANRIANRLCPGEYCVDDSTPGVITIDTQPGGEYDNVLEDRELSEIAKDLDVWSVADASRMLETRALDGTQTSTNGAVTWTYHPDSGLDIVIDVESLPSAD